MKDVKSPEKPASTAQPAPRAYDLHADVVTEACVHIAVTRDRVDDDGMIADGDIRRRIAAVVETLGRHAATRPAWDPASRER